MDFRKKIKAQFFFKSTLSVDFSILLQLDKELFKVKIYKIYMHRYFFLPQKFLLHLSFRRNNSMTQYNDSFYIQNI